MKRFRQMLGALVLPVFLMAAEPVTNEDVVKLAKAGLSESFVLSLVEERPSKFVTDTSSLIDLKRQGVSERIVGAMLKKTPATEAMNTDSVMRLSKAGFSESFLLGLIQNGRGQFSTNADRIIELKQAGLSERVIAAMVDKSPGSSDIPPGTAVSVRLIDDIDSQKAQVGDTFRASLAEPLTVSGRTLAERGADATLKLVEEKESGRLAGKAVLSIQLVSLKVGGRDVALNTAEFTQESNSRGKETVVRTGVGSAIGAVVGAIAGGGKGAAIGAGVGAGAGAGSQVFTKGERVRIPSETLLTFQTTAPVAAR
jgi:hypothetical protein